MNEDLLEELKIELQSKDESVRQTALTCLLRLGSGEQIYELIRKISEEDESPKLRYLAKKGLDSLNIKARPEFQEAKDLIRKLLENVGSKRLEVYRRVLKGNDSFLKVEMINLSISDQSNSYDINSELVALIKEQLISETDLYLIAQYVKALGHFGSNKDVNYLQKLLQNKNPRIVANAIEALQLIDEITAVNMVIPLLKHKDNRVRGNAILLVHSQDPARALTELETMASSQMLWMRSSALYCIKTLEFEKKEEYLAKMLREESDENIITDIIDWMKFSGFKLSAEALYQKLDCTSDDINESIKNTLETCLERCKISLEDLTKEIVESRSTFESEHSTARQENKQKSTFPKRDRSYKNFYAKITSVLKLSALITIISFSLYFVTDLMSSKTLVSPYGDSTKTVASSADFSTYAEANFYKSKGLHMEANKTLKGLSQKYPYDSLIILDYAESLAMIGRYTKCLEYLSASKSKIKQSPRYYRLLAKATLHSTRSQKRRG